VLKAIDLTLQRVVAIKVLAPHLATHATARQRFVREARAAASIRNEHVIDIHAVEEANGVPHIVTEFINGVSGQEKRDREGPLAVLSWAWAVGWDANQIPRTKPILSIREPFIVGYSSDRLGRASRRTHEVFNSPDAFRPENVCGPLCSTLIRGDRL